MNRRALILSLVLLLTLLPVFSIGSVYASGTTTITASGSARTLGNGGASNQDVAQSFQVSSGYLSQFTVKFGANTGSPSGTVTYEFRNDSSNSPTGSVIDTGTFTPTASATNTVTLSPLNLLSGSTTYWLVLKPTTTQSAGVAWTVQVSTSSTYANGDCATRINNGAWTVSSTTDMESSYTTVDPTATATPPSSVTPTITPTLSATPTITLTPSKTPTPDFYAVSTLDPSGQDVAVVYTITGGETANFAALIVLIIVEFVKIYLLLGIKQP